MPPALEIPQPGNERTEDSAEICQHKRKISVVVEQKGPA